MDSSSGEAGEATRLENLPPALIASILSTLDVSSIFSAGSTCKILRSCARQILSFLPIFDLVDVALPLDFLKPMLLPPNPLLRSLRLDCSALNDSAIPLLARSSLHDLRLHNCSEFSWRLLSEVGTHCKELRSLYLGSVAERHGRPVFFPDLYTLLDGCSCLESLALMFDLSMIRWHRFVTGWSVRLATLEIGYLSSVMATRVFSSGGEYFQNLKKLCLSVDCITDTMMTAISQTLQWLTYLDVRDAPPTEPRVVMDLTDSGFQRINPGGRLSHLSIVRSQEFIFTYFKRVTDLGILLMADRCAAVRSVCLGGFCRVTDTGIRALLHACSDLRRLKISHGPQLTDLVFHDISATSLSLSHVSLRWCSLLTDSAVLSLSFNAGLAVVDLRACRNIGDESLRFIVNLHGLTTLMLDGSDITDGGLLHLRETIVPSLTSLSLRGCRRLTGGCMSSLFLSGVDVHHHLRELDVSYLPNLSDDGIMLLAKCRVPLTELRMRQCPLIGDTAVMALASMRVDARSVHGGSLRLLDLFSCGNITPLSFRWLKKPYFPKLRWLGLSGGSRNRDLVEALRRNRPFLRVERGGDELGATYWDNCFNVLDYEELDELEQWLLAGDGEDGDDAEHYM